MDRPDNKWIQDVERIERLNPLSYVKKDFPPALIICGGLDPSNVILNCSAMFDKYIREGAAASYYALSTGTHVRVGAAIEQAIANWLPERLAKTPSLFPVQMSLKTERSAIRHGVTGRIADPVRRVRWA